MRIWIWRKGEVLEASLSWPFVLMPRPLPLPLPLLYDLEEAEGSLLLRRLAGSPSHHLISSPLDAGDVDGDGG